MSIDRITIRRPDDWHLHLRDGPHMRAVLSHTVQRFARAIIMPNLKPPVTTTELALDYRKRLLDMRPAGARFEPLMTLYLTDNTRPEEIGKARQSGAVHAVKYYPAGATTHSDAGVTDISRCYGVLEAMEAHAMPLLVHGEVTDRNVDIFDREEVFIERVLTPLHARFPRLKIVLEHITTKRAAQFVGEAPANIAATITAHHLLINRNALFDGGMRPHLYCLPIAKREHHREALVAAATSGSPKYFLGTDSAPHARHAKEASCACAGIYTAHAALELYAEVFDAAGKLDRLEAFASDFGADFYGLARNEGRVTLVREAWTVPSEVEFGAEALVPFRAGEPIAWKLV